MNVLDVILPISLIVLMGYLSVSFKILPREHMQILSAFVIRIALPAFLLYALSSKNIEELWHPSYVIAYGVGSLIIFAMAYGIYRHVLKHNLTQTAVLSMGASMSNTGFIGTAILTLLIGNHAAVYISLTLILENILILALVLTLAEAGLQQGAVKDVLRQTISKVLKTPVILAILLGLLMMLMQWHFPKPIAQSLEMLGRTASSVALFVIGGSLVGISLKALNGASVLLVAIKCFLMPLVIFLLLSLLPNVSREMLFAGTLLAALPMPIAFGIFGQHYGLNEKAFAPLMLSTLVGFAVVSWWIAYFWT